MCKLTLYTLTSLLTIIGGGNKSESASINCQLCPLPKELLMVALNRRLACGGTICDIVTVTGQEGQHHLKLFFSTGKQEKRNNDMGILCSI